MAPRSSTVARWELARRLGSRRRSLGIDHKTIANTLNFSRNYWSAVENERTLLSREKLDSIVELFEFDEETAEELRDLREMARERGWWQTYTDRFGGNVTRLFGLEHGASSIRNYESLVVPGLLQTEAYARSVIELDPFFGKVGVQDAVEVRLRRQQRILGDDPVEYSVILSQAALVQQWGGLDVQVGQLEYLLDVTERANVALRVLPFETAPGLLGNSSTLVFLSFESRYLPTIAFQEVVRLLDPIDAGEPEFRRLELCWNEGRRLALGTIDSRRLIERVIDSLAEGGSDHHH